MCRKYDVFLCVLLLVLFGCEVPKTPSFYTTENGLKYKYHDIVTNEREPQVGDYLNMYMEWKTLDDSVFYSSIDDQQFGIESFRLKQSKIKGGIHEGFFSIMEGDSVSFYVKPNDFYKYYKSSKAPVFLKKHKQIKIIIRLISIKDSVGQIEFKKEQLLKLKLKEEFIIDGVVKEWRNNFDTVLEYGDVYIVPLNSVNDISVINEGRIEVDYSMSLHDGTVLYSTFLNEANEFDMEAEGQMLDGFKYILQQISVKEHVLALVPSYLGFGSNGSSDGKVYPYSPLIFDVIVNRRVED